MLILVELRVWKRPAHRLDEFLRGNERTPTGRCRSSNPVFAASAKDLLGIDRPEVGEPWQPQPVRTMTLDGTAAR